MANTNSPFGFRWHGLSGDPVTPASGLVTVKVASTNTGVFGEGDPVLRLSTGYVTAFTRTTVVSQLVGIFQSCEYYSTSQGRKVYKNYWPGSDATGDVLVHVNPCSGSVTPRFLVQSSGATAITFGNVGINVDIAAGTSTAGTVTGGFYRSACTIDLLATPHAEPACVRSVARAAQHPAAAAGCGVCPPTNPPVAIMPRCVYIRSADVTPIVPTAVS